MSVLPEQEEKTVVKNPFIERNKVQKHGQKAEKRTAKRFEVIRRAGSGSVDGFKGDFEVRNFLVENKTTEHRSISLKYDWLRKISKEALAENKEPALAIQFVDREGNPIATDAKWVCIPERLFNEMS